MSAETYLNHPTFGLLFRVCVVDNENELFATLYAQRLFFCVTTTSTDTRFEPISRTDSRMLLENRLRTLRRMGKYAEYESLMKIYKQTFQ